MVGKLYKESLLAALRESLDSSDLESVKRAADSLHQGGGDPVAALSNIVLNELPDSDQRTLALRALKHLDSSTAASIAERLRGTSTSREPRRTTLGTPSGQACASQRDPSKWWIFGSLTALAILWPAYSVYRFNHPRPSEPPKPMSPWTEQEVDFEARSACRSAVRQQLRDPDSADFPALSPSEVRTSYTSGTVTGYLHASNGLGLKVRADYLCTFEVDRRARTLSVLEADLIQR